LGSPTNLATNTVNLAHQASYVVQPRHWALSMQAPAEGAKLFSGHPAPPRDR
jgi:hypothetical protein